MNIECEKMYDKEWLEEKIYKIKPKSRIKLNESIYTTKEAYDILIKVVNSLIKKDKIYDYEFFDKMAYAISNVGYSGDKNEISDYKQARMNLESWIEEEFDDLQEECDCDVCKMDKFEFKMDNYEPPESYPDWDGDESIMYYIEHYSESNDDELTCPVCGSDDLENYGGCFICNDCGCRDNI
jgi:hypothetical protein